MLETTKRRVRSILHGTPDEYESLPTEPIDRGAESRTSKQPREVQANPEVPGDEQKILQYLEQHLDEVISYDDIARGSTVQKNRVGKVIHKLLAGGAVVRSNPSRHGTRYWINRSGPNTEGKNTKQPSIVDGSGEDDIDFVKTSEELIFKFVRATRSTDVLLYLTWLEQEGRVDV